MCLSGSEDQRGLPTLDIANAQIDSDGRELAASSPFRSTAVKVDPMLRSISSRSAVLLVALAVSTAYAVLFTSSNPGMLAVICVTCRTYWQRSY